MLHSEQRRSQRRILRLESLEERRLLVVGGLPVPQADTYQNPGNPEDANGDGEISPVDALSVINVLNQATGEETGSPNMNDVNGDGEVTPLDALLIINRINSNSPGSTVAPELRAQRLRDALESENLPPQIDSDEAQEILATLEQGGRWELGERYRNGEMININDISEEAATEAKATEDQSLSVLANEGSQSDTGSEALPYDADLPVELNEAMSPVGDDSIPSTLIQDTVAEMQSRVCEQIASAADDVGDDLGDAHQRLADRLDNVLGDLELPDWEALANELRPEWTEFAPSLENLVADLQQSVTAQSIRDAIYQALSNLDIPLILEQIRVDVGDLVEVACNSSEQNQPLTQLLAGDALTLL